MNRKLKLTKQKIVSLAVVVALFAVAAMGTLAYFTDTATARNVITTGKIQITLNDKTVQSGVLVDFPEDGVFGIMPGVDVDKIVSVTNDSAVEAYVRVRLEMSINDKKGESLPLVFTDCNQVSTPAMKPNYINGESWILGSDGCWYYSRALNAGETTDILFDKVSFAEELGNEYQNSTAIVLVTAEAVQVANNPVPADGTVEDVLGWPSDTEGGEA